MSACLLYFPPFGLQTNCVHLMLDFRVEVKASDEWVLKRLGCRGEAVKRRSHQAPARAAQLLPAKTTRLNRV